MPIRGPAISTAPGSNDRASSPSAPAGAGEILPAEQVFLDLPVPAKPPPEATAPSVRRRLPGPGLPEALLWTLGCGVAQLIGAVALSVAYIILNELRVGATFDQLLFDHAVALSQIVCSGCIALLAVGGAAITPLGWAWVLAQALTVVVLAELQWMGLRRTRPGGQGVLAA